ncbi:DUF6881 domain-containing protein [Actinokineospora globicatena]|uniref:DUF6881 domain-containing protein n=1 Tax=Actinokineospora globicatena TaxID=103729 RepID=UPI0020A34B6F|nr:hypothetical protein [Actinokineospora globicatena]GLW81036.1 hypothetical protein Aglo01_55170 [Actinokineospora globicatena]GLW88229.1 hypothetical protein Aglo02_58680 [Actinokineospora globicatena]
MLYLWAEWIHDEAKEPVLLISELDGDRHEVRKVQVYRDGRAAWADGGHETDEIGLGEVAVPSLEFIKRASGVQGLVRFVGGF